MGLFGGSDDSDPPIDGERNLSPNEVPEGRDSRLDTFPGGSATYSQDRYSPAELVQRADGGIKVKKIRDSSGTLTKWLNRPVIEYLKPDEQPEYVYSSLNNELEFEYPDGSSGTIGYSDGAQFYVITDDRIMYINGAGKESANNGHDDEILTRDYDNIKQVAAKDAWLSDGIGFVDKEEGKFTYDIRGGGDVDDAIEFIRRKTSIDNDNKKDSQIQEQVNNADGADNKKDSQIQEQVDNASGATVTYEVLEGSPILDSLDNNEQIQHVLEGKFLLVERRDEIEKKGGIDGSVVTAVTDKRVFCIIESGKRSGNTINIPYDSVTSIEFGEPPEDEWELGIKIFGTISGKTEKLILHTQGPIYYLDFNTDLLGYADQHESDYVHEVIGYIREQRKNTTGQSGVTKSESSERDPLDQIERLKELNEQGAITDKEFQQKKSELLDQI